MREISPVADPATRTYQVKVTLKNPPEQMRFGGSVVGRLKTATDAGRRAAGQRAVRQGRPARRVGGRSRAAAQLGLKPVTVARYETDRVIVSDGLAKGDIVVTAGVNRLRENQKVRLAEGACTMTSFNLSDWALRHKSFVVYLMLAAAIAGAVGLRQARPRGRPAVHHQDHGGEDAVAGRHRPPTRCSRSPIASRRSSRSCPTSTSCAATPSPASRWCSST